MNKIKKLPVPLMPAMVGACTLSNVYLGLGYTWIRHITMVAATVIWILFFIRIITQWKIFKEEYSQTVLCSLYAGFTMLMMIIGSYFYEWFPTFGKAFWLLGIVIHAVHIIIFTYRNILKGVNMDTFVPSYFVTYNGIMVSAVVGGSMNEPQLLKCIVYYGICIFTILIPFMIYRLRFIPIKDSFYHTQAILLAPSSLCVVTYLSVSENPNKILLGYLYVAVLCALIFIIYKLPKFFEFEFKPTYAGLTFPMAIGIVATTKVSAYLTAQGLELGAFLKELAGIQTYLTTGIIFYVLLRIYMLMKKA